MAVTSVQARQRVRSRALIGVRSHSSISGMLQMERLKRLPSKSLMPTTVSPYQSFGARESMPRLTAPSGTSMNKTFSPNITSDTAAMAALATIMSPIPISRFLAILSLAASGRRSISLTAFCKIIPISSPIRFTAIPRRRVRPYLHSRTFLASSSCLGFATGGI